jgi:hypothetical protein
MKIDVIEYNEETGTCTMDLDNEAQRYLLERGFNAFLKDAIENYMEEFQDDTSND